ncbi:MAG: hypothetical protein AAFU03_01155, partial [Bacteroidota bacterium]
PERTDSATIANLNFRFNEESSAATDEAYYYTYNTFVQNGARIHCDFESTTWIDQVSYSVSRLNNAALTISSSRQYHAAKVKPLAGTDINLAGVNEMEFSAFQRQDNGWSTNTGSTEYVYSGSPDMVQLNLNILASGNATRANSILQVEKWNDSLSSWEALSAAATGYIRNSSGHNTTSYNSSVSDMNPGLNPRYRVTHQRETATAATVTLDAIKSNFEMIAWE